MKLTKQAVDFFNYSSGIIRVSPEKDIMCVIIRKVDDEYKFFIESKYPEDFDIDWYAITKSGWDFTVVFIEDEIFNSTIDYNRTLPENERLQVLV